MSRTLNHGLQPASKSRRDEPAVAVPWGRAMGALAADRAGPPGPAFILAAPRALDKPPAMDHPTGTAGPTI